MTSNWPSASLSSASLRVAEQFLQGAFAAFFKVDGHDGCQAEPDVGVRVLSSGVLPVACPDPQEVDVAYVAARDGFLKRRCAGGPPVVVGIPGGHHRAYRVWITGLHDAVDDLVVAPVPADRDNQHVPAATGSLPGQIDGVACVICGLQRDVSGVGKKRCEPGPQVLGEFGGVPGAVGVEDDDY